MKHNIQKTSPQAKNSGILQDNASALPVDESQKMVALEAAWKARLAPIIERLRASQMQYSEDEEMRGLTAGRLWAEESADTIELRRLKAADELWWGLNFQIDLPYSHAEQFFFAIRPERDGDSAAAAEFWSTITGRRAVPERIFVISFAEQAMEVWDQAADEI